MPNGHGTSAPSTGARARLFRCCRAPTPSHLGGRYEGEMRDGKKHGHGKYASVEGHV